MTYTVSSGTLLTTTLDYTIPFLYRTCLRSSCGLVKAQDFYQVNLISNSAVTRMNRRWRLEWHLAEIDHVHQKKTTSHVKSFLRDVKGFSVQCKIPLHMWARVSFVKRLLHDVKGLTVQNVYTSFAFAIRFLFSVVFSLLVSILWRFCALVLSFQTRAV